MAVPFQEMNFTNEREAKSRPSFTMFPEGYKFCEIADKLALPVFNFT